MSSGTPRRDPLVSFAMPVRNGAATIRQAIQSVREQTFEDWELVISDNLSTDNTAEICSAFARLDTRIVHAPTGRDLSQNENFNAAFHATRSRYFRWVGDDDWLEPDYAERCVTALEMNPHAVLCTTVQRYYRDEQPLEAPDYITRIGGVNAGDPVERISQLFRLWRRGHLQGIDPIYSMTRREVMVETALMAPYRFGDFILACEMALKGPFVHVADVLGNRRLAAPIPNLQALQRFTNKTGWTNYVQREISLFKVWQRSECDLSLEQRVRLIAPLLGFGVREHAHGVVRRAGAMHARTRGAERTSTDRSQPWD